MSPTLFPEDAAVYPGGSGMVDFVLGTGGELSSTTHRGGGGACGIFSDPSMIYLFVIVLLISPSRACEAVDDGCGLAFSRSGLT
jgi:hypothetical protein